MILTVLMMLFRPKSRTMRDRIVAVTVACACTVLFHAWEFQTWECPYIIEQETNYP